jgi:hypothetical protein
MYRKYNFLLRMIMKRIAQRAGASTDTSRDHVFTAWRDLDDLVRKLVEAVTATISVQGNGEGRRAPASMKYRIRSFFRVE